MRVILNLDFEEAPSLQGLAGGSTGYVKYDISLAVSSGIHAAEPPLLYSREPQEIRMRTATVERKTRETEIAVSLDLDGTGRCDIDTGIGFLDHMLESFAPPFHDRPEGAGHRRPACRLSPHHRGHRHRHRPGGETGAGRFFRHHPFRLRP